MSTAIVTGGAVRMGKAMAIRLAQRGFNIALHHNASSVDGALEEILALGVKCKTYQKDFSDLSQAKGFVREISEDFSDLELLINSSANFILENLEATTDKTLQDTVNINLLAPYILMRDYKKQVNRGMIVNILDQRILKNIPSFAAYSVAKAGLAHLTQLGAVEWGKTVRVNGIAPGLILPPPGGPEDYCQREAPKIPTQTHGSLVDITRGLDYLLDSPFVNGEILFIDGGESKGTGKTTY